ncbi:RNA-binding protein YlmH, contains S4-like domain [Lachnospiraceae bacterium C7]|nr:RNA-binding protein YlmH, contains S4-like domain [Lachnospiraceae bacterium C7]
MNKEELCKKRLLDLGKSANYKNIVMFSDFLNLNEQSIFYAIEKELGCKYQLFGGYEQAERQMIAFIPDALYYEWEFPISCLECSIKDTRYSENLTHRDVLGALMHLGIERSVLGDIVFDHSYEDKMVFYIFCDDTMADYICDNLFNIKHTNVNLTKASAETIKNVKINFKERNELIASNRIDALIAKAYRISRADAQKLITSEKVFVNGKQILSYSYSTKSDDIISVRGQGRFKVFFSDELSKKGKIKVRLNFYI